MKKSFLYIALALSVLMAGVHIFVGGALIARPLLESDLSQLPKLTLYLCWHGITIVLAGQALLFADALFWRRARDSARLATGLAFAFFLLDWLLIGRFGLSPLDLPQWIAFGPMAVCGCFALRKR